MLCAVYGVFSLQRYIKDTKLAIVGMGKSTNDPVIGLIYNK